MPIEIEPPPGQSFQTTSQPSVHRVRVSGAALGNMLRDPTLQVLDWTRVDADTYVVRYIERPKTSTMGTNMMHGQITGPFGYWNFPVLSAVLPSSSSSSFQMASVVELASTINEYVIDEMHDNEKYINLANRLRKYGYGEEAQMVETIAQDEARHAATLRGILRRLAP
jgi:hypothetical protein